MVAAACEVGEDLVVVWEDAIRMRRMISEPGNPHRLSVNRLQAGKLTETFLHSTPCLEGLNWA